MQASSSEFSTDLIFWKKTWSRTFKVRRWDTSVVNSSDDEDERNKRRRSTPVHYSLYYRHFKKVFFLYHDCGVASISVKHIKMSVVNACVEFNSYRIWQPVCPPPSDWAWRGAERELCPASSDCHRPPPPAPRRLAAGPTVSPCSCRVTHTHIHKHR